VQPLEAAIDCFENEFTTEGQCQKTALNKAAVCHRDCCDVEQANVEICTGDCFVTRSTCHVTALGGYETCYLGPAACNDAVTCAICDARFDSATDQCNADAQRCSQICVMTHRKS
jgi:hypothetical protein